MRDSLQRRCNLFMENRDILKKNCHMENRYIYPVCANIFAGKGKLVDSVAVQNSKSVLRVENSAFSNFRGNGTLPMISMLAISNDPKGKMEQAKAIYKRLKQEFVGSPYLALVAMILTDMVSVEESDSYIQRGRAIYNRMKAEHPFLTSGEDSVFAVLMAFSNKNDDALICEMEEAFNHMKRQYASKNAVQSLSHVVVLTEGSAVEKCEKAMCIRDLLQKNGRKYGTHYELAVLGAAAILPVDTETLVQDILDVDTFLALQKGYGVFSTDRKTRLMHATMIVTSEYADGNESENANIAALTGTLAMIAAQQAAMCAAVAASAGSAAASS